MQRGEMKVVGTLKKTAWERFARLQRTVAKMPGFVGQPRGVFKFRTHEEADAWKKKVTAR